MCWFYAVADFVTGDSRCVLLW